jgi:hypothetical protein
MKFSFFIAVFAASILCECYSFKHSQSVQKPNLNKSKFKFVNYAFLNKQKIKTTTVPIKNFKIEVSDDWVAKALFDGDNYNVTGFSNI